jgi:hypothetical protein
VERILAGVRENSAQRIAGDSWNSLSDHRLHARAGLFSSRRHLRITALESVYNSYSDPVGNVISDSAAGCPAQEKTSASAMDGIRMVERPSDGVGHKILDWPGILVADGIGISNYALKGCWG